MEKYTIEIETPIGWSTYHVLMQAEREEGFKVLAELRDKFPNANFRLVHWKGEVMKE